MNTLFPDFYVMSDAVMNANDLILISSEIWFKKQIKIIKNNPENTKESCIFCEKHFFPSYIFSLNPQQ